VVRERRHPERRVPVLQHQLRAEELAFLHTVGDECATVQANRNWQFEAIAFHVELPSFNGNCAPGEQPLYRLYNNGQGGAPNHRYTTSLDVRDVMLQQGWTPKATGLSARLPAYRSDDG
jgi:hypothetical protein